MNFYPLKFTPIFKEMIWGGKALQEQLGKAIPSDKTGESWELSGVNGNVSKISNGELAGLDLNDLIARFPSQILGWKTNEKARGQFPLLIKFIDACDDLSIQVHPNDELALQRHKSAGKTEMWYILETAPEARLISGFSEQLTSQTYAEHVKNNTLAEVLQTHSVQQGDVFFIPAGRVHAIGKGILLLEIQQTSDITYRIFDYNRRDAQGKTRELHTEQALEAIDYTFDDGHKTDYEVAPNAPSLLATSPYFTTNLLQLNQAVARDFSALDSFVIYVCTQGAARIEYAAGKYETIDKGETVLLPAALTHVKLVPQTASATLVEVYV